MTDLRTAAQQALDWLYDNDILHPTKVSEALRAALAQQAEPVQEPVAYIHRQGNHWEVSERHLDSDEKARGWTEEPLYTAPPHQKQVGWMQKSTGVIRCDWGFDTTGYVPVYAAQEQSE